MAGMTTLEAARRVRDVLNEVLAAGFTTTLVDWPQSLSVCRADATFATAEPLAVMEHDGEWAVVGDAAVFEGAEAGDGA